MRSTSIIWSVSFFVLLGLGGQLKGAERPNILLLSIDDLNDWVGCLGGHPQALTPNIDRLAKRGTLFSNAHCQSPVCNPSRASLMTGRYPHSTGIYFLSPPLSQAPALEGVLTLPEHLAANGYHTMAVGKLFHGNDKQYFKEYGGNNGGFGPRPKEKLSQPHGHPLWDWGVFPNNDEEMPDMKATHWAVNKLQQDYKQPFLLGVGFYRPHVPMYASQRWFDLHPRNQIELPKVQLNDRSDLSQYAIDLTNKEHVSPLHEWVKSAGQWEHAVQSYLASVSFADHCLGKVLDALDASPHADNTIIVLFSDHGFHLGEKQRWAKRTLWEDGTRVPIIISAPGFAADQQTQRPAELLDIFPTLLELTGLEADLRQEGQSLVPLMQVPDAHWPHPAITSFGPGNYAVRSSHYRFIQYRDGSQELYDHRSDPNEWTNLAGDETMDTIIAEHAAHLPVWEKEVLPGKSTGHNAFNAANHSLTKP